MIEDTTVAHMPNSNTTEAHSGLELSPAERKQRTKRSLSTIHKYVVMSSGMGFVPVPLVSQVAVSGILVWMLAELCGEYGTRVSDHKIKVGVASVLGGAHSGWISNYTAVHIDRLVPGLSYMAGQVIRPLTAGVITYTIGRMFLRELESGNWGNES